jgi:hypothetical protein
LWLSKTTLSVILSPMERLFRIRAFNFFYSHDIYAHYARSRFIAQRRTHLQYSILCISAGFLKRGVRKLLNLQYSLSILWSWCAHKQRQCNHETTGHQTLSLVRSRTQGFHPCRTLLVTLDNVLPDIL